MNGKPIEKKLGVTISIRANTAKGGLKASVNGSGYRLGSNDGSHINVLQAGEGESFLALHVRQVTWWRFDPDGVPNFLPHKEMCFFIRKCASR